MNKKMTNVEKYYDIMNRYKSGEFGNTENLTMHEIFERAGEPDLFNKMTKSQLELLRNISTGKTRSFLNSLIN